MPLSFSSFTEIMRKRRIAEIIPLLEITAYKNRFDTSPPTVTIRLSDRDRKNVLGVNWTGLTGSWGSAAAGIARNGMLDLKLNNTKPVQGKKRLSDLFNIGANTIGTFDTSLWDAKLFLLPAGGGSGDQFEVIRLILEEPAQITEESVILRFSGVELFLNAYDATALPATIITVQGTAHGGTEIGTGTDVTCTVTTAGGFRYLIVATMIDNPGVVHVLSVKANGVLMTLLNDEVDKTALFSGGNPISGNCRVQMWGLKNPPLGAVTVVAHTDDVPPIPPGTGFASKVIGAIAFDNVLQGVSDTDGIDGRDPAYTGAVNQSAFADANPRVNVPGVLGELCVDAVGYFFETAILPDLTVDVADQTQRVNRSDVANPGGTGDNVRLAMSTRLAVTGAAHMDWNNVGGFTRNWVAVGASLKSV